MNAHHIEEEARRLQLEIFKHRRILWPDREAHPLEMVDPRVAAHILGIKFEEVHSLAFNVLPGEKRVTAGILDRPGKEIWVATEFGYEVTLDPDQDQREITPMPREGLGVEIRSQSDVRLEEIPLLEDDDAAAALRVLKEKGYSKEQISDAMDALEPVPTTKARERQAKRASLDMRCRTSAGRILGERGINPGGRDLDPKRQKPNFVFMKTTLDKHANKFVGRKENERSEFSRDDLERIEANFAAIEAAAIGEIFDGN